MNTVFQSAKCLCLFAFVVLAACGSPQRVPDDGPAALRQPATENSPTTAQSTEAAPLPPPDPLLPDDFPQTIGGLQRAHVQDYGRPALGYSVKYRGPSGMIVDVYVYDLDIVDIGNGHELPEVADQVQMATRDIFKMQDMGAYASVVKKGNPVVRIGDDRLGVNAAGAVFSLEVQGRPALSYLYVTGFRKKFLKIRCTYLFSEETAQENSELLRRFLLELGPVIMNAK